jgi:hypothetical protein
MHGQVRQERYDPWFGREEVVVRPHVVVTDESGRSLPQRSARCGWEVVRTEHRPHVIEACGWWMLRHADDPFVGCPEIDDYRSRVRLPDNHTHIT